jgi:transposase
MPFVNTEAMQVFLDRFAATIGDDEHVAMVLDQAGWHASGALRIPDNVTLVPLPPYSPELNPVERVWLHLKERFLSHRLLADYDAIAGRRLQRMEPPMRRGRAPHFAMLLSLDSTGQTLGGAV